MAYALADRVLETSTTQGTGTLNLAGATTGYQSFVDGVGDGNTCAYTIKDGTNWETGIGTVTAGSPDTLSRDTVLASSNSDAAVDWGSGTRDVYIAPLAGDILSKRRNETITGDYTISGTTTLSGGATLSGANTLSGDTTMSSATFKLAKGADVASASALPVISDGNYFDVTGTTTITSINSLGVGTVIKLHFDGVLTLTHHATDLILPGGANITTAAGDEAEFVEYASGDWRCTNYERASGAPLAGDYTSQILYARREETSGTTGGAATTGSLQTLAINTVVTNEISGASLSSNKVTLPAGTYRITGRSPFYRCNAGYMQIYNVTDTAEIAQGNNFFSNSVDGDTNVGDVYGVVTLAGTKEISLRYRVTTNSGTSDLGTAKSFSGVKEIYGEIIIEKVGTS